MPTRQILGEKYIKNELARTIAFVAIEKQAFKEDKAKDS